MTALPLTKWENKERFTSSAQAYRERLIASLPTQSILSNQLLNSYPLGSDVSKVPETSGLLSQRQIEITNLDATDILSRIANKTYSAEEVTLAFGLRAAIAHQLVSCLTELWLEDALVRARELDAYLAEHGKVCGPLHGLPISLKDQIAIKGRVTSLGYLSLHEQAKPSETTAALAEILQNAGAIFYCHTTLPQSIMHLECESFWGRTLNPFNTSLTSGGSSGGEGALVAMRGSPLGIGTDIGGSVRSPAANCGLYGLRPTAQRIPNAGSKTYVPGRDSILGVIGPLTHSLRDVELFMDVVLSHRSAPWVVDPSYLPLPWRGPSQLSLDKKSRKKIKVGVMWTDGEVRPTRPIRRAMEGLVQKLKENEEEFEVVEFQPYKSRDAWYIIRQLYFVDGGRRVKDLTCNSETKETLHPLTDWLLNDAGTKPVDDITDTHKLWELNVVRETYRAEYSLHWNSQHVDVVLCPVAPYPAPPHGEAKWWSYTSLWNLVDYPGFAFPSGLVVDPELDKETESYTPLNEDDELVYTSYAPERFANAPISLQLVAKKYRDEDVVEALARIEELIKR
ncbi:amidase [Meredithblackwellia eburnea MCA 4105]